MPVFATTSPDDWTTAHTDPDTGWSSSLCLSVPGLSIVSSFSRPADPAEELGDPWIVHGRPIAWGGSVRILFADVELATVPGFSVRASARVPEPDSPGDRAVPPWKIGLFRISSLAEFDPVSRGYAQAEFDQALQELGITPA